MLRSNKSNLKAQRSYSHPVDRSIGLICDQTIVLTGFIGLGGHSLVAAQAAARIKEAFGLGVELRTFLESPTVAALAKEIQFRIKIKDTTSSNRDTDREEIAL